MGDGTEEPVRVLDLGGVAHPVEHVEGNGGVAGRGSAGEGHVHELVLGPVQQERRTGGRGRREVGVEVAGDLLEERPGRVGVCRRGLGVGIAFGGEEDEASAQVRVEALRVVQGHPETQLDEPLRAEHPGARRDRVAPECRHHHRHVARGPYPRRQRDATPWEYRVHEHERVDEIGAARGDAGTDHATHRVPEDRRGTGLLQQTEHEVAVRRDRRVSLGCACSSEPDEVDGRHGRVEAIREELPDGLPRQRAGAEAVDEDDLTLAGCTRVRGLGVARRPADRVRTDAVDLEVPRSAGVHPPRLGDGHRAIPLVHVRGWWTGDDGGAKVGWIDPVEPS